MKHAATIALVLALAVPATAEEVIAFSPLLANADGIAAIPVRQGGVVLSVGRHSDGGPVTPALFILQDTTSQIIVRCFLVVTADKIFDSRGTSYIGSSGGTNSSAVFHVFEFPPRIVGGECGEVPDA